MTYSKQHNHILVALFCQPLPLVVLNMKIVKNGEEERRQLLTAWIIEQCRRHALQALDCLTMEGNLSARSATRGMPVTKFPMFST